MEKHTPIKCSFCGKDKHDVSILIAGLSGHICDHCVTQAQHIVKDELGNKKTLDLSTELELLSPKQIKQHLDEYVIGQTKPRRYFRWLFTIITKEFCIVLKTPMILKLISQTLY